jgi:hypothetical protein
MLSQPPVGLFHRDGGPVTVEDGQRRVDDLIGRDDLGRHDPRVELSCITHEKFEGDRTVEKSLNEVVARGIKEVDVDDVVNRIVDEGLRGVRDLLGHDTVDDDPLAEQLLCDNFHELHADAGIEQVHGDEPFEQVSVDVDGVPSEELLRVHC